MKVQDIIKEFDEEDDRQYPNPIRVDYERATDIYDLGDEVLGELVSLYNKEHNITKFTPAQWVEAANVQREKYGKVMTVPVSNLISMETHLYEPHMKKLASDEKVQSTGNLPIIFKTGNDLLVADGNHRVVSEIERGAENIKALVLDLDTLSKQLKIENRE